MDKDKNLIISADILFKNGVRFKCLGIRENGYAIDNMEHEEDVKCIGAPIFDIQNSVVASISLSGPSSRITKEKENEFAILVKSSALNISKKLAASSPVIGE